MEDREGVGHKSNSFPGLTEGVRDEEVDIKVLSKIDSEYMHSFLGRIVLTRIRLDWLRFDAFENRVLAINFKLTCNNPRLIIYGAKSDFECSIDAGCSLILSSVLMLVFDDGFPFVQGF